jgi:hypothetical protein
VAGPALLERVARGDHLCWMVDDDRARLDATAAYLDTGLRLGQRVVYCGDAPERTLAAVAERGVAVGEALRTGRLATGTTDGTYLTGGVFDAAGTIARWRATVEQARADGCTGLRAMGEMSWARCRLPGAGSPARPTCPTAPRWPPCASSCSPVWPPMAR